ncbi:MAG: PTS sugar transporter subunit IIA [Treponema sp.]|jgi:PTS system nitrogen regulatory IIA component|nr:PTS sugar transporter subunit IIA [Treponema sp.]
MFEGDILTIEEVAKYLRVSERTVYDWAQKGEIPAGKIGTVWRFKKSEIEHWVNDRLTASKPPQRSSVVQLETIVSPDRILFLNNLSKHDALLAMVDKLAQLPQVKNAQELAKEIFKREELMSTAIGRGIAVPHVRLSSVTDLVVSIGISRTDIVDFKPLDDEPVRLILMIAAAYKQRDYYLQTISFFSARFKNPMFRAELLAAQDAQAAYELLLKSQHCL